VNLCPKSVVCIGKDINLSCMDHNMYWEQKKDKSIEQGICCMLNEIKSISLE